MIRITEVRVLALIGLVCGLALSLLAWIIMESRGLDVGYRLIMTIVAFVAGSTGVILFLIFLPKELSAESISGEFEKTITT